MKTGIVVWALNIFGSTQRLALELAKNLKKLGNKVKIYVVC